MRKNTNHITLLFSLICCILVSNAFHASDNLEIKALTPKGIQVTLPHSPGIRLFSFHCNINTPISRAEHGEIAGDVVEKTEGKWTFRNLNVELKPGDTIYYWIFIQKNKLGYIIQGQHKIKNAVVEADIKSNTTTCKTENNASVICQNLVVNLTQSVFDLQDELAALQETNRILQDLVKTNQNLSQRLVLKGLDGNANELTMIVNVIIMEKLNLSIDVRNVSRKDDGTVEFQVRDLDEKVQILRAAKIMLKNSRYDIV